jgi:hypothetical protein
MMSEGIFKVSKDIVRAKSMIQMANERLNDIIPSFPKDKAYKFIEEYYEIIVQLITALMYCDGYKTLGHLELIEYLSKNYNILSNNQIELIDRLRKFRHGVVYYGKKVSEEFMANNEEDIKLIITSLNQLVEEKVKDS